MEKKIKFEARLNFFLASLMDFEITLEFTKKENCIDFSCRLTTLNRNGVIETRTKTTIMQQLRVLIVKYFIELEDFSSI